jgi:hypothetical protein
MTETVEQTQEQRIEELRQEKQQLREAEEKLRDEQARLEQEREAVLDSDDSAVLEAALSGKPLPKSSSIRKAMDRLDELPHQLYAIRRRYLQVSIELAELEQEALVAEREETSKEAYAAAEAFEQACEERDHTQAVAVAVAEDLREKIRSVGNLRDQLAAHESSKPSGDLFEERLRSHKVWRW